MTDYTVAEARNHLPQLLDRALAGEDVTITRRGKVIAQIIPRAEPRAMTVDLEWLDKVRVKTADPTLDFTALIRDMRDEKY
ncbi:MAG TPA: type II toxin-antitoxin system prevent-host-death family antitoxin [Caulobacteraceae bacterium]|jgi:prevent-host-death family protein|nr:type II toxin-antitoxin system prevent-host-death family antitoxin [Caulobacteraceae bacterium]